eukprot:jgi/Chlat1/149/Chrsp1S00228
MRRLGMGAGASWRFSLVAAAAMLSMTILLVLLYSFARDVAGRPCVARDYVPPRRSAHGQVWRNGRPEWAGLESLVMVAGHAVYTGTDLTHPDDDKAWFLEPYQKMRKGEHGAGATFADAIKLGVLMAAESPEAMLLFSGGETRRAAGPRSEAHSYWSVADALDWFGKEEVRSRAFTEEYARDSFENVLFSICRFRELTGHYPKNFTVVSYEAKRARFVDMHRVAIAFPFKRFEFRGVSLPDTVELVAAMEGETHTVSQFRSDPYGCSESLSQKRLDRDPFARTSPYPTACPELTELFNHCGPQPYVGRLPWDS